jgi:hypothetical protein
MRTALYVTGGILLGLILVSLAFCATFILVFVICCWGVRDGQAGIGVTILGAFVGAPVALVVGSFWLSFCLGQFAKKGIIPNAMPGQRRDA